MKYKEFGKFLKDLLEQRELSGRQLSLLIGKSPTFVCNMTRGVNLPSDETLDDIARVLGNRDRLYQSAGRIPPEVFDTVKNEIFLWEWVRNNPWRKRQEIIGQQ